MNSQNKTSPCDEELLDSAIVEFLRAESAGQACDRQKWLDRYPACAAGLAQYFDDRDRFDRLMRPVRVEHLATAGGRAPDGQQGSSNSGVHVDTVEFMPTPALLSGARYRLLRFHARGGMGEIWLAEDTRIGRQVALKKLRAGRQERQARFLVEAQVTGQLEHPSVVPLHDLGHDENGQPFYIMKFIQGRRLTDAIADYHAKKASSDWPSDLQFRRLLETFVSVCNAVAYAHSKGVLHRDIKPDNVMLGPYGETLVVDWGLAKVLGQPDQPVSTSVRLSGGASSSATQDGAIVGSPYYMAPEGAERGADAIDHFSDVYLLGATLYQILTAKPPRQGSSQQELIDLAREGRPIIPRQVDPRIPRALEAICLKAMAYRKEDRYDNPISLAEDIQRFLAGEPTSVYKEPWWTQLGRWIHRHRRKILRAAAMGCVLVLGGLALRGYRQAQWFAEREQSRKQISEFYRLADDAQFFAANTDAVSERVPYYDPRRAVVLGEAALAIAAPWGQQALDLPLPDERPEMLKMQYDLLLQMARVDLQEHQQQGADLHKALALLDQARAIQQPSRGYFQLRSRCLTFLNDLPAAKQEADRAVQSDTPVTAVDHFLQGELLRFEDAGSSARIIDDDGKLRREHLANAIEEYRTALQQNPRHYWAQLQLGRCLLALGRGPEAIEALSTCIATRPAAPWAYTTRGLANALSGRAHEALADLDRAVQLDPLFQPARLNRGVVHWLRASTSAAPADFDAALADFDAVLAAPADQRLSEAGFYRGQLLLKKQRDRDALSDFSRVIDANPSFRAAYWFRAQTQFRLGHYAEGQSDLVEFSALAERLQNGSSPTQTHFVRGKALRLLAQELDGEARSEALLEAAEQLQAAIAADARNTEAFQQFGEVRQLQGKLPAAIESYSQGLKISAENVELRNLRGWAYSGENQSELARADFSEAIRRAPDNPESHTGLGYVLANAGAADAARSEVSAALLSGADNYLVLHNVACIYGRLSQSQPERKVDHENSALTALKRAVTLWRQSTAVHDANEIELIRHEEAFPDSLRSRPEFQFLLTSDGIRDH